jgi:hypothetical protein
MKWILSKSKSDVDYLRRYLEVRTGKEQQLREDMTETEIERVYW